MFESLLLTAAFVGFIHTFLGPDHYVPFVALSITRGWGKKKTAFIVLLCGFAHIIGSAVLGMLGVAIGVSLMRLNILETNRAAWAGYLFLGFALIYTGYQAYRTIKNKTGGHHHNIPRDKSFWALLFIFFLGPHEVLIPLLIYPAAEHNWASVISVVGIFGVVSILTMLLCVFLIQVGVKKLSISSLSRYSNLLGGLAILSLAFFMVF